MHPTRDELRAFLLGKIDEQQALSINSHIDTCPACEDTFQSLETFEDKLVHLLRTAPVDDPYEQEPACQELIRRVESMSWNSPSGSAETAAAGAVPAAPAAALGKIGQYELVEKLGEGGMGAVYKARHTRLKRMVAIKVLPPDRMDNAEAVARFQREMEAVGRLQHPNIVAAHDAGEVDGTHFLVMEFVNGLTLSTLAQQPEALGVANACELVRQAACGLEHAHQHGLVHRDIKPSNLILARDGTVKVLDLGLARLWGGDVVEDELTSTGQIMGTADYIAPDQALDPHGADIRADIYSLGCTLYHLLAGRPPFRGPGFVNVIQKVMAHAHTPVPPLQDTRKDLPAGLIDVINRMLAKSPADRYATPAALIAALEPYCAGASLTGLVAPLQEPAAAPGQGSTHATASRDVGALCETHITTSAQEAPAEPASTTLAAAPPRRGSGRRLTTIAGGAAALVLLLGVILLKTGSGELELHVNEPDVQVSIDGTLQKIELKSPRDQVTITVPAGKHTLRVGKDGFEADVQEFRIVRNGKVELSATLKPLSTAKSDPARQTDPVPVPVETPAAKAGWQGWPADAPPPAIAPFNAEQAQQHQEAWARYLRVPVEYSNSIGMKFRLIPPGEFTMGSSATKIAAEIERTQGSPLPENIRSEGPDRRVRLARPFFLGMHEVTQGQFAAVMGTTPSAHSPQGSRK